MRNAKNLRKILEPPKTLRSADFTNVFTEPFSIQTYAHTDEGLQLLNTPMGGMDIDVIYENDWTEKSFLSAKHQMLEIIEDQNSNDTNFGIDARDTTFMVLPYLSDKHLKSLFDDKLNGLDLCGNTIMKTANQFIWISGKPNKFRIDKSIKNPYAGKSALVGRMLLNRPVFRTPEDFVNTINAQGGQLTSSTIYRVIKELRDEVIVDSYQNNKIYLLQPEKLLDRLTEAWSYTTKQTRVLWRGKISQAPQEFLPILFSNAASANLNAAMTGVGSVSHYTNVGMEKTAYVYANAAKPLLENLEAQATEFFPNLEIRQPPNETVFFDVQTDRNGIPWASLLQTYLEMSNDDTRLQQSALVLRKQILETVLKKREVNL